MTPPRSPRHPRRGSSRTPVLGLVTGLALAVGLQTALAQRLDVAPFDALLRQHVRDGAVDYAGFRDNADFRAYLDRIAQPGVPADRAERLAHWINAYNALAIAGIVEGLSPSSFFGRARYFRLKTWPLDGRSITLHELEHAIIRPLGEPRVHFALVCASRSCPPLRSEAYTGAALDAQLDDQARRFINDPAHNRFDRAAGVAQLSEIFKWYDEDFTAAAGSTQRYLARYVADPAIARLLAADALRIEWIPYDWSLNGALPPG